MQPTTAPLGSYIPKNDTATYLWFRRLIDASEHREEDGFCAYSTDLNVAPTFAQAVELQGLVEGRKSTWRGNRCYRITALGRAALADYEAAQGMPSLDRDAFLKGQALSRLMGEAA